MNKQEIQQQIEELEQKMYAPDFWNDKDGKKLSEALEIMHKMNNNHEIDKDLFEIFVK